MTTPKTHVNCGFCGKPFVFMVCTVEDGKTVSLEVNVEGEQVALELPNAEVRRRQMPIFKHNISYPVTFRCNSCKAERREETLHFQKMLTYLYPQDITQMQRDAWWEQFRKDTADFDIQRIRQDFLSWPNR